MDIAHRRYVIRTMAFMVPYVAISMAAIRGAFDDRTTPGSYLLGLAVAAPVIGQLWATLALMHDADEYVRALTAKRFIDRFKLEVGMTPKRYCRIRRFQHALRLANRGCRIEWTDVALDCGYFDQAHFIHDFQRFAGLTPTAYQAVRTSFQNHVKFLQSGADGI